MSTRKIVANTFYYGVVPKLTMLLSIVILPLTTPFLTTFDYGIYGVLTSYTSLFVSIAPLGLHVHLTNSYFEYPRHYHLVWGRVLLMVLLSSFVFGLLNVGILLFTLPLGVSWKGLVLCLAGSVPIFLLANGLLAQHLFPLVERPKPLVFTNLTGSVLGMLVSFVLIYFFRLGYWGLISSGVVSGIFVFTVFLKFVWSDYHIRPIWDRNRKRMLRMLKIALPLIPHTLGFVLLTSSARIVMSQYHVSYDEIGLFSHGSTMGDYAVVITSALAMALTPQIQRAFRSSDFRSYRKLYFLCQAVALTTSFMICVWMPDIYGLLIRNARLAQSCDIACMLCFANVVFSFYVFMSAPAFIEKNTMQLLWLVFVPGILNFVLCYTLIPLFGYRAAIYSTIVSYWSQLLIPFFVGYYRKTVGVWLGGRWKIPVILLLILADLLIANQLMYIALWQKVLITLVAASLLWMFYRRQQLGELV
ncbi:MAG: oligosaccharide flippase family protein [Prevotella sp.]|nr:oligosaccharide flippase family protein [Prevotella sp.]